jgi:CheY-like chemotaxis protein
VKSLIELHDGRVTAASDGVGRGSTFTVRLPLAVGAPPAVGATSEASNEETRRILIIEDNLDAREMLRTVLEMDGHEVELADNGLGGVQIGLATRPDVVLVDIGLPGIDGYEVARRLRRHLGDDVRLVALTGYGQPEDRRKSRQAGFNMHLTKPIDPEVLTTALGSSSHTA